MTTKLTDETQIAVMGVKITAIQSDIAEIKADIKSLSGIYITASYYDQEQKVLTDRLKKIENQSNFWKWMSPSLAAVMGAVLTFLLTQYIQHIK